MILKILDSLEKATSLEAYPFYTKKIEDCIVYNYLPSSDDGAKAHKRLELRIITKDLESAERYRKLCIQALIPIGDAEKIEGIKACVLNGGGQLKDDGTNTIHTLLYFDIILRSENI